jgi:DNA-binding response OmpR family regulator
LSKQSLLLVDGDTRSLRVLEVSLRKAGFTVTPAVSVGDALDKLEISAPDLIISETKFSTELDDFELRRRLRATAGWAEIPFIFLTAETAIENKIKGLELGVDDYLTKPIYIKEIVTRINILLQKKQRQSFDIKKDGTRFAGRVADIPVVDVIQTIEVSRKSGVIQFTGGANRNATIYFRDGKVIDAEAGTLQGEDAVYRLLTWNDGDFEVEFRTVRRREAISMSSQGLLMEGMRRLDEWSRLLEQLPPLTHRFEIDAAELAVRLGEVPDDNNRILRLFDTKRTLLEVIDSSDFGDLECLQAISKLYFEGLLVDLDPEQQRTRRETGKPVPMTLLHEDSAPTPIEEVASGPIAAAAYASRASKSESQPTFTPRESEAPTAFVPRESGEIVSDQNVISEELEPGTATEHGAEHAAESATEREVESDEIQPPLQGSYRQSSLRLIDEAVAAAQLIEPSLFDADELAAAGVKPGPPSPPPGAPAEKPLARVQLAQVEAPPRNGARKPPTNPPPIPDAAMVASAPILDVDPDVSGEHKVVTPPPPPSKVEQVTADDIVEREDYTGVPTVIEAEASPPSSSPIDQLGDEPPTDPSRSRRSAPLIKREEPETVRMIGSHGQDRAEAAGELAPTPPKPPELPQVQQREMVTIMPRRNTREIPTLDPAKLDTAKADAAKSDAKTDAKSDAAKSDAKIAEGKPAVEPPKSPARRVATEGGGVVRASTGPGRGAIALLTLGVLLVGGTVFSYCRKKPPAQPIVSVPQDAASVAVAEADATEYGGFGIDASSVTRDATAVATARPDAAVRADAALVATTKPDAGAGRADAAVQVATTEDAGVDKAKEARDLYNKGHTALEDGDPETALDLLDKSLAVKKSQRTFLEKARALQRMSKIDEAIAAIDQAIKMGESYAPAWEQKGMLLWSAQRYNEARPVLEHYLELDPTGKKADTIRSMLEENK